MINWRANRVNFTLMGIVMGVVIIVMVASYRRNSAPGPVKIVEKSAVPKSHLSHLEGQLREFIDHLHTKYEFNPKIVRVKERLRETRFVENTTNTFVQNKGEVISLCLRNGSDLYDHNTLMFVLLHEAAHIYSSSVGHGPEFWRNFRFLLVEASKLGIYTPVDYSKSPVRYCGGKMISDSPLFNWDANNVA